MWQKFSEKSARIKLVIVTKFGYTGHLEPCGENVALLWLWSIKSGFFLRNYFT